MNINIPDKLYKLLTLIGLILIGYSFYNTEFIEQKYFSEIDKHREVRDSLLLSEMILKNEKQTLIGISESLSKKYSVENPISYSDSTVSFNRILNGPKNDLIVSDSLNNLWKGYLTNSFKLDLISKKLEFSIKYLEEEENLKKAYFDNYDEIRNFGFFILFLGILLWTADIPSQQNKNKPTKQEEKIYANCQSCGKKFTSILKYGTNKNKTKNYAFCKNCFESGKFTNPDLTKDEFLNKTMESVKNKNWFYRRILKNKLDELERWSDNKY